MFTVANTALFKGFPLVQENDRILYLTTTKNAVSYPDDQDWQSRAQSFERIAMSRGVFTTLSLNGAAPATQFTTQVTANAFALVGVKPILGRDFLPSDQQPGAAPVVILRNDLWRNRFAGRRNIIGTTILLNGVPTVIGVMPADFSFPEDQMLWTPLVPTGEALERKNFFARYGATTAQKPTKHSDGPSAWCYSSCLRTLPIFYSIVRCVGRGTSPFVWRSEQAVEALFARSC